MSKFKVGDMVYRLFGRGKVDVVMNNESHNYPITAGGCTYLQDGKHSDSAIFRTLFHATKENHTALSILFPEIEFELPPLTNNEVVQQMLKDGKPVMCWLSNYSYEKALEKRVLGLVLAYNQHEGFNVGGGDYWPYVVPMTHSDVMSKIGFVQENVNEIPN